MIDSINLSIEEILSLNIFNEHILLAGGAGLVNECSNMVILETPDGMNWLTGKEFVITAGYAFNSEVFKKVDLITIAYERGASAIGIKSGRYFGDIDDKMIAQANAYGIPLIEIPATTNYTTIINAFYNSLFNKRNQFLLEINEAYYKLLSLVIKGVGVEDIIQEVSSLIKCKVDFINPYLMNVEGIHLQLSKGATVFDGYRYYPVGGDSKLGILRVNASGKLSEFQEDCIRYGVALIINVLNTEQYVLWNRGELHKIICELILTGYNLSDSFYKNIENSLGWIEDLYAAVYINWKGKPDRNIEVRRFFENNLNSNFLYTVDEGNMLIFVNMGRSEITQILKDMDAISLLKPGEAAIGCSEVSGDIRSFKRLYQEAKLSSKYIDSGYKFYEDLGIKKLIFSMAEDREIEYVYLSVINPVRDYDSQHKCQLLKTLMSFVKLNYNRKQTAEELFIHVETLRYRLQKIEELTGHSFVESDGIFVYKLACELVNILN